MMAGNNPGRPRKDGTTRFFQRCADRTCGVCIRCRRVRAWAEGKYASRRNRRREDHWPPEQDERLRELAGTMDRRDIAQVLSREFPTLPRSAQAVAVYASRNGISLWPPGRSLWEIGRILGVTPTRVEAWIDLGWLVAMPYTARAGRAFSKWRVQDAAIEAFIRAHPEHYRAARVTGNSSLAMLARLYARTARPARFSRAHPGRAA